MNRPQQNPKHSLAFERRRSCRGAFGLCAMAFFACTLTRDEFEPLLVERSALLPDASTLAPSGCETDVGCSAGEVCQDGACVAASGEDSVAPREDAGVKAPCVGSDCASEAPLPLAPSCGDGMKNGEELGIDCGGSCVGCPEGTACALGGDCQSGVCSEASACAAPTCDDGATNQDETDTDCGGRCERGCSAGDRCRVDGDCATGSFCPESTLICAPVSCDDGLRNGAEILTDCGGGACAGCPDGSRCSAEVDCESGVCSADTCAAPACDDGVRNGSETGVDCGGGCARNCPVGGGCTAGSDCQTSVCGEVGCDEALAACCQAPACDDGVRNGSETAVDCGNAACGPCPLGSTCVADAQCSLQFCLAGVCRNPGTCSDGARNGRETGTDCGGDRCSPCGDLSRCNADADCVNDNCDARGICISCGDGVQDGTETGVDCGGTDPACRRCNAGERCGSNDDCNGLLCSAGVCG